MPRRFNTARHSLGTKSHAYDPGVMRSPLSPVPSLRSRRKRRAATTLLVGVPRVSPERELAVLAALMKPKPARRLQHQIDNGEQDCSAAEFDQPRALAARATSAFAVDIELHIPPGGEFLALCLIAAEHETIALALGLLISHHLPGRWIVAGRYFLRDEIIHRRERGFRLNLRPAKNVHLSKETRRIFRQVRAADSGGK